MSRSDRERLLDVLDAIAAIHRHLARGPLTDGLIFDAVRVRLIEIGEAVKDVPADVLARQPHIPWRQVAAMRDQLAHRYFDTSPSIVLHTVVIDLAELATTTRCNAGVMTDAVSFRPDEDALRALSVRGTGRPSPRPSARG